jgi:uncharacterized tellurite resistance protein B-like protein
MSKNDSSSSAAVSALLSRMQSEKHKGRPRSKDEVSYATTMMLMEVALCDHTIDRFEKTVIHNGLKGLFKLSDEAATNLMNRAKANLSSMRGSSEHVEMLRDSLDVHAKRAVAQIMDNLIRCNGVVTGGEVYLRKRFREILGVPEEMPGHTE